MKGYTHITMKKSTQRAQSFIRRYKFYREKGIDNIFKAYGRPSQAKVDAYNDIEKEMKDVGGYGMVITGAGCNFFSCAYRLKDDLVVHVPTDVFVIKDVFNS